MPEISVVMATYNGEKYIEKAIESILKQTFEDFEFIIIDDASTDNTKNIINRIIDNRIHYYRNDINRGLAYSLNKGFSLAKGKYIARMDDDDISFPNRLKVQYDYMEIHKDITLCGCWFQTIGNSREVYYLPENYESLRVRTLFYSPLAHSSWFIRKKHIEEDGLMYNVKYRTAQDYELFERLINKRRVACVQEKLLYYRIHSKSLTRKTKGLDKNTIKVQKKILKKLKLPINQTTIEAINYGRCNNDLSKCIKFLLFMLHINFNNNKLLYFDKEALKRESIFRIWHIFGNLIDNKFMRYNIEKAQAKIMR